MTLFNKYRPNRFEDVAQAIVCRVLQSQIITDSTVPAYVFFGPPGTGKTTLGRIMAMALMCENRKGASSPCGSCSSCQAIRDDRHRDVMEINCATNGGVDEVRSLIAEKMRLAPSQGEYRIFILDECHLLTTQAQNALLKIMEEPPPYVRFFLCTTEANKIINAIKSRCQNFRLTRVSDQNQRTILTRVIEAEGIEVESEALSLIIQAAQGSSRTALVILEQCIPIGVTEENVRQVLDRGPRMMAIDLLKAIKDCKRANSYKIIETASQEGRDLSALIDEAARSLMTLVRYRLLKVSEENRDPYLNELYNGFTPAQIVDVTNSLLDITNKIRQNVSADLVVQTGLLKIIDRFAKMKEAATKE